MQRPASKSNAGEPTSGDDVVVGVDGALTAAPTFKKPNSAVQAPPQGPEEDYTSDNE